MDPRADFGGRAVTQIVTEDPEVIEKANKALEQLDGEGKLLPIPGWEGSPLEGYRDILGLNGRPIRQNRVNGLRR